MSFIKFVRRIGKALLHAGPKVVTTVNIGQIYYGEILKGKTVVITGGSQGIGFAIAKKCVSEGARVLISGRNEQNLRSACEKLGSNAVYSVYDVQDVKNAQRFLDDCKCVLNAPINYLVSNAGVSLHEGGFQNVTVEGFEQQFDTNLKAGYFLSKAFVEMKLKEEVVESAVLFVTSETGEMAYDIPYGLTKSALNSYVGGLSRRVYKDGIRINAIAPGVTISEMTKGYTDINNLTREGQAAGRVFLPEEVAEVACFLLSDASKCISGEVIHCNAGNHLKTYFSE